MTFSEWRKALTRHGFQDRDQDELAEEILDDWKEERGEAETLFVEIVERADAGRNTVS